MKNGHQLAEEVASFMDSLDEQHGEDTTLVDALIVCEISHDGSQKTSVHGSTISGRHVVAAGLCVRCLDAISESDPD